jgi:hypothetical protein
VQSVLEQLIDPVTSLRRLRSPYTDDAFLTDDAIMVLPIGVLDRSAAIAAMRDAPPWTAYDLSDVQVVSLGDKAAMLLPGDVAAKRPAGVSRPEHHVRAR